MRCNDKRRYFSDAVIASSGLASSDSICFCNGFISWIIPVIFSWGEKQRYKSITTTDVAADQQTIESHIGITVSKTAMMAFTTGINMLKNSMISGKVVLYSQSTNPDRLAIPKRVSAKPKIIVLLHNCHRPQIIMTVPP